MHKSFHLKDNMDKLYVSRKEGGRGLVSIEDSVDASRRRLEEDLKKIKERLIIATRSTTGNIKISTRITRIQKRKEKQPAHS